MPDTYCYMGGINFMLSFFISKAKSSQCQEVALNMKYRSTLSELNIRDFEGHILYK